MVKKVKRLVCLEVIFVKGVKTYKQFFMHNIFYEVFHYFNINLR